MMYQHKNNGTIAELIEKNDKSKMVTVKPVDGEKKGKNVAVTLSTFQRWWRKLDDATVETVQASVSKEATSEEVKEQEHEKVESKPVEQKPERKKNKSGKRVDNSANVAEIKDFILKIVSKKKSCEVGVPSDENMQFRALRVNGRQFCKLMWSAKNVRLYFRCDLSDIDGITKVNYALPYLYIVDILNSDNKDIITSMFDRAVEFESSRKSEKSKKKKEDK